MSSIGGKLLHELGVRQGSLLRAADVSEARRREWIETRADKRRREWRASNRLKDGALLVVLSQDCDISCANDGEEPLVEFAVMHPIPSPYAGSQFARSARKLHVPFDERWYEIKSADIFHVRKDELLEDLSGIGLCQLNEDNWASLARWRALRYSRTALPDSFNRCFLGSQSHFLVQIGEIGSELVRGVYISLDSYEERPTYVFEFFLLIKDCASDEHLSLFIDIVEALHDRLKESGIGEEADHAQVHYAARDSAMTVKDLSRFVRVNFDYVSLSKDELPSDDH